MQHTTLINLENGQCTFSGDFHSGISAFVTFNAVNVPLDDVEGILFPEIIALFSSFFSPREEKHSPKEELERRKSFAYELGMI